MNGFKNSGKSKLLIIVGTRPEIIRLAAVINKCRKYFDCLVTHTGQNYDYNLNGVFYEELPNMDVGGSVHDGEAATDETAFAEVARIRICPREQEYGIQIPQGAWHSIVVHEPSTIFEAKDGAYGK